MRPNVMFQALDLLALQASGLSDFSFAYRQAAFCSSLPFEFMNPPLSDLEAFGQLAHAPMTFIVRFHHSLPQIQRIGLHSLMGYTIEKVCTIY